ncbi:MAG: polymer-forming cytoskeletal protein [Candidatus Tantalella remota]|nr:polymer-forming cytoskeletal protein [Candidatus Tantalella remota]
MRKKKTEPTTHQAEEKFLDVNASMQGTLRFDDPVNLRINGKFEGTLDTKGVLVIGQKADIQANVTGESITIAGSVNGNIKAATVLKLESNATLNGDVDAPKLSISEGAVLNGQIRMQQSASSVSVASRGDWMTMSQLAKYLEVDAGKVNDWVTGGVIPGTREGGEWVFDKTKVDQWIAEGRVKA